MTRLTWGRLSLRMAAGAEAPLRSSLPEPSKRSHARHHSACAMHSLFQPLEPLIVAGDTRRGGAQR
jgi:hypothetical protein